MWLLSTYRFQEILRPRKMYLGRTYFTILRHYRYCFLGPRRTSRRKARSFHLLHLFCVHLHVHAADKCNAAPDMMPGLYQRWLPAQASCSCPHPGVAAVGHSPRPSVQHRVQGAQVAQPASILFSIACQSWLAHRPVSPIAWLVSFHTTSSDSCWWE